ncbi:hypothetical protein NS183_05720 [Microbacterium testaceum]|nr:hypothetical protein NS183_05720 [Microbacterium testaceum]
MTLTVALLGCAANPSLAIDESEPSSEAIAPVVPTCPDQLRQDLRMQFGEAAQPMTPAELGARLGASVPDGVACIYTGSSGYVGSTAYLAFYPNADQATVAAITGALGTAGYTQEEAARWAKGGNWATANAYLAGDSLHYGDYFNDAPLVVFEGSFAD